MSPALQNLLDQAEGSASESAACIERDLGGVAGVQLTKLASLASALTLDDLVGMNPAIAGLLTTVIESTATNPLCLERDLGGAAGVQLAILGAILASSGGSGFDPNAPAAILLPDAGWDLQATWNNAGTTFRGLEIQITDTASAAGSTPFRILGGAAGTTELFSVDKNGSVQMAGNPIAFSATGGFKSYGSNVVFFDPTDFSFFTNIWLDDAKNIKLQTTTGTKIGTATNQKLGFWDTTPVVQQVLATGAGATVDNVITLLQTIGLCRQS